MSEISIKLKVDNGMIHSIEITPPECVEEIKEPPPRSLRRQTVGQHVVHRRRTRSRQLPRFLVIHKFYGDFV